MYQVKRLSNSEFVQIRKLRYHVRRWGSAVPDRPPLVMVHGWMDVAASFQFVVDAFGESFMQGRPIIAPDWRGFGLTAPGTAAPHQGADGPLGAQREHAVPSVGTPCGQDNFWFPDYLADLDFLLDHYAPDQPVDLVGHSMGGNVAMLYAGVRPERIRRLINLEGFGMPATKPSQAPQRYAQWMDELKSLHRGELALKTYDDAAGVALRLMKTNPRLNQDKADWLAQHWARPNAQGRWEIRGDAAHKLVNANLYQVDEVLEIYRRISAPTLSVTAQDDSLSQWWKGRYTLQEYRDRIKLVSLLKEAVIEDAAHMLHHDQPAALARQIERFLSS